MIQVIAFDLDDTLWAVKPIIINAEERLNNWLAANVPQLKYDVSSMRELRHDLLNAEPQLINRISEFRQRLMERAMMLSDINAQLSNVLSHQAMEIFLEARNEIVFYDGAMDAIKQLSSRFTLGALSNGNADIKRLGLKDYFSFGFTAEEVGAPKPAPNLFNRALEHAGCEPHQMVYVGDDPVLDVDSANERGLHTVWVKHPEKDKVGSTDPDEVIGHIRQLPAAIDQLIRKLNAAG